HLGPRRYPAKLTHPPGARLARSVASSPRSESVSSASPTTTERRIWLPYWTSHQRDDCGDTWPPSPCSAWEIRPRSARLAPAVSISTATAPDEIDSSSGPHR